MSKSTKLRKNIVMEGQLWETCIILSSILKISISDIIMKALIKYFEEEQKNNVVFKVKLLLKNKPHQLSQEDHKRILSGLASMDPEKMKYVECIEVNDKTIESIEKNNNKT